MPDKKDVYNSDFLQLMQLPYNFLDGKKEVALFENVKFRSCNVATDFPLKPENKLQELQELQELQGCNTLKERVIFFLKDNKNLTISLISISLCENLESISQK